MWTFGNAYLNVPSPPMSICARNLKKRGAVTLADIGTMALLYIRLKSCDIKFYRIFPILFILSNLFIVKQAAEEHCF